MCNSKFSNIRLIVWQFIAEIKFSMRRDLMLREVWVNNKKLIIQRIECKSDKCGYFCRNFQKVTSLNLLK